MYIIAPLFFHLYRADNGKDTSSSRNIIKVKKPVDVEIISLG
jgi:hypothetical protein